MAHFYGTLQGNRGEGTRAGSKDSGLTATAASWQGAVEVRLYEKDGTDYARVSLRRWYGAGTERELYDGPVGGAPVEVGVAG